MWGHKNEILDALGGIKVDVSTTHVGVWKCEMITNARNTRDEIH